MSLPLITSDYQNEIYDEYLPVVVEFFSKWCSKCAMISAPLERIAMRNRHLFLVKRVDIEVSKDTADMLGIELVPTFVVYYRGQIISYTAGVFTEDSLERRLLDMTRESVR